MYGERATAQWRQLEAVVASLTQKVEQRFYGKYRGFVVDQADPERLGRLKLQVPSVLGPRVVTGWAMPCVPYGGDANQGFLSIPAVGAGVWVEFEEGDLEFPIWVGTFWSKPGGESELPKPNDAAGKEHEQVQDPPTRKILKTSKGHTIQFEDTDNEEMVTLIEATHGHVITMNGEGIAITDGKNGHKVVLNNAGITIAEGHSTAAEGLNAATKITMAASEITVETSGTQIVLGAEGIKIGGNRATEPFVLGNQFQVAVSTFLMALRTHTHAGNLGAPTSPPLLPIELDLQVPRSAKHKVE